MTKDSTRSGPIDKKYNTKMDFKAHPPTVYSSHNTTWEGSWKQIEKTLEGVDIKNFRQYEPIIHRINTKIAFYKGLWTTACADILPEYLEDTLIGNPNNVEKFKDVKVTGNSLRHAYFISRIRTQFKPTEPIRVLEIGAGYGGLAEQLFRQYKVAMYHFIDAPVMQKLQKYYMIEAGHEDKISFEHPRAKEVDLIIAINALVEIPTDAVTSYIRLFEHVIKPAEGLLYINQAKAIETGAHRLTAWEAHDFGSGWNLAINKPNIIEPYATRFVECFGRYKEFSNGTPKNSSY